MFQHRFGFVQLIGMEERPAEHPPPHERSRIDRHRLASFLHGFGRAARIDERRGQDRGGTRTSDPAPPRRASATLPRSRAPPAGRRSRPAARLNARRIQLERLAKRCAGAVEVVLAHLLQHGERGEGVGEFGSSRRARRAAAGPDASPRFQGAVRSSRRRRRRRRCCPSGRVVGIEFNGPAEVIERRQDAAPRRESNRRPFR